MIVGKLGIHIAKNDDFGRDRRRCLNRKDLALKYNDELTIELIELMNEKNLSQGVPKVMSGIGENSEVISEY